MFMFSAHAFTFILGIKQKYFLKLPQKISELLKIYLPVGGAPQLLCPLLLLTTLRSKRANPKISFSVIVSFLVCRLTFFHFSLSPTHYSFVHSVVSHKSRYLKVCTPASSLESWCGLGSGCVGARPVWRLLTGYNVTSYEVAGCNHQPPHTTLYNIHHTIHYTIQYNHYTTHNITINIP